MPDIKTLILENEKLIYKAASYFTQYNKDDLFQAGAIGMIMAYQKFDESRGVKFTTYAYPYILGEMTKLVREDKGLKVSRDISRLKSKLEKVKGLLAQQLMREPTTAELSAYLEIPEDDIIMALNANTTFKSLDDNVYGTTMMMHEIISSPNVDRDTLIYLKTELEQLEEPERSIMIQRYYEDLTQAEIADNLGLSQVDVSRREKKVLLKLRQTI